MTYTKKILAVKLSTLTAVELDNLKTLDKIVSFELTELINGNNILKQQIIHINFIVDSVINFYLFSNASTDTNRILRSQIKK